MNSVTIANILTKSGYIILGVTSDFITIEDPTCIIRSISGFIDFAWLVMSLITTILLFGWGIALIRGAETKIMENIKHLFLLFGSLAIIPAILKFLLNLDVKEGLIFEESTRYAVRQTKSQKNDNPGRGKTSEQRDDDLVVIRTSKNIPTSTPGCGKISISIEDINNAMKVPELNNKEPGWHLLKYMESPVIEDDNGTRKYESDSTSSTSGLSTSETGLNIIKDFEGAGGFNELTQKFMPYNDPAEYPTIGYGHLINSGEDFSNGLTEKEALDLLAKDARVAENAVKNNVTVPLSQYQFDALVSLAYNIGAGAFARSDIVKYINNSDLTNLESEWESYNKGGGVVLQGLVRRRRVEYRLFTSGTY